VYPLLLEYSRRLLDVCEAHCRLVSRSGVLRVDVGTEFLACTAEKAGESRVASEERLPQRHFCPQQWFVTGHGFVVRFFCNEITSSLDVNWFSGQTSYPIVYVAAYATAQQLQARLLRRVRSEATM
jgi:hypothetical protein